MENQNQNCSLCKNSQVKALIFCFICKEFMCNKCLNNHSKLFNNNHKMSKINEEQEIFTGFCKEKNHNNELKYFCKTHNQLCCAACLSIIKDSENGQHKDCNVSNIKDIQEIKKNELMKNILCMEKLHNNIENIINELKNNYNDYKLNKERLQKEVQNIFSMIRNAFNQREDEILLKIDEIFNNFLIKEEKQRQIMKFPDKINTVLIESKIVGDKWNTDAKLNSIINDCIKLESDFININKLYNEIQEFNSNKKIIKFRPGQNDINEFLNKIKSFGKIIDEKINNGNIINNFNLQYNINFNNNLNNNINQNNLKNINLIDIFNDNSLLNKDFNNYINLNNNNFNNNKILNNILNNSNNNINNLNINNSNNNISNIFNMKIPNTNFINNINKIHINSQNENNNKNMENDFNNIIYNDFKNMSINENNNNKANHFNNDDYLTDNENNNEDNYNEDNYNQYNNNVSNLNGSFSYSFLNSINDNNIKKRKNKKRRKKKNKKNNNNENNQ